MTLEIQALSRRVCDLDPCPSRGSDPPPEFAVVIPMGPSHCLLPPRAAISLSTSVHSSLLDWSQLSLGRGRRTRQPLGMGERVGG